MTGPGPGGRVYTAWSQGVQANESPRRSRGGKRMASARAGKEESEERTRTRKTG